MNFKTTYILFGVLLVMVGVFAFVLWYDPTGRNKAGEFVLPALHGADATVKAADIDRIEIDRREPQEKIVMVRDNDSGHWTIVEPRTLRADKAAVTNLIQQVFEAAPEKNIDKAPTLAAWGLEPPLAVITLKKGNTNEYKLDIGKTTAGGNDALIYVLDPARPKDPMGVKKNRLDAALKPLDDFRDAELLASAAGDLQSVELTQDKESVGWKKDDRGHWLYTDPKNYGEATTGFDDTGAVPSLPGEVKTPKTIDTVLTDLANLKAEKNDNKTEFIDDVSDFGKYNVDSSKGPVLQIDVTRQEEIGKDENGKIKTKSVPVTLLVGVGHQTEEKSGKYYAHIKGEKTVVKVAAKSVDPLLKLLTDKGALRDKNLVHMDGPPSAVNIKNAYGLIQLRRTAGPPAPKLPPELEMQLGRQPPSPDRWTLWRDDNTSEPVDMGVMQAPQSLINLLRQKDVIDGFVDRKETKEEQAKQEAQLGIDKDSVVVELWNDADGVKKDDTAGSKPEDKAKKPELKSKDPTYRLTFGRIVHERDKDLVYVKRETRNKDGGYDVTLVQIPQLALDDAKKGPLAYLDKKLPPFLEGGLPPWPGVTKVVIQRGKTPVVVTRAKDDAPWIIAEPTEMKGRNADKGKIDDLLFKLNKLTALRLVEDKPKDDDLQGTYGLKSPAAMVEITMTKDGKPATFTYDFGKETPTPAGEVYGRQSQRPNLIFTVAKSVVEGLPSDILDLTVFTLDFDKLKKVTMTGWQDVVGSPLTMEFEKKDNKWEVTKGLPKDKFDAAKLTKLLDNLRETRAISFVTFKNGPKPDQKLDPANGALVIELTVEGEMKPITLTIGALNGDKGFFATSNRLPGDVFMMPKATFEGVKSKPAYFNP